MSTSESTEAVARPDPPENPAEIWVSCFYDERHAHGPIVIDADHTEAAALAAEAEFRAHLEKMGRFRGRHHTSFGATPQRYVRADVADAAVEAERQDKNLKVGLLKGERKDLREETTALRREHEALQVRHAALLALAHMTMNVAAKGRDALPDLGGLCVLADTAIVNDGDAALAAKGTGA